MGLVWIPGNATRYLHVLRFYVSLQHILCSIARVTLEPSTSYASYTIALKFFLNKTL